MGFAPTPQGGIGGETLFLTTEPEPIVADRRLERGGSLLARIDDGTNITIAGRFPDTLRGLKGELSSRSDGKLFAFFTGEPFELAEIDPATADVRWQRSLEGMRFSEPSSGSWAVGADFFFFCANRDEPSTVTRLREDGTIEHVIRDAGIQIVGAGASTCATRKPKKERPSAEAPAGAETPKAEARPPADPPQPAPAQAAAVPFSRLPRLPPSNPKVAPPKRKLPEVSSRPRR